MCFMKILVTGGAGFIGSHTCLELLNNNYEVVIADNLSNAKRDVIDKIKAISLKDIKFYEIDVCNKNDLRNLFSKEKIDAVIHFAGFKAVGESVKLPLKYYRNNLDSTITLLEVMEEFGVKKLVFSSSATVYGMPKTLPIKEDFPLATTNPYGTTKLMIENILHDVILGSNDWCIAVLRYFNPIGGHESGLLYENPNGIPNNLMPYIIKVARGELPVLGVFGNDYDTIDGTGVRDYIHVVDLAKGHVNAINYVFANKGLDYYNLGTGKGTSVLELVHAFERVNHVKIPYEFKKRREGDIAICYADPSKAFKKLGFKATKTVDDMCRDAFLFSKRDNNE